MKKLFLTTLTAALLSLSVSTFASENVVPAWACNLNFKGHAAGLQVIVGAFSVKADGILTCISPLEEVKTIPVKIDMSSSLLAPRIGLGSFDVYGDAAQISLFNTAPEDLLGTYYVAAGQGAIVAGAGAMTAIHADIPELTMNVSVQFVKGFGLNLGFTKMTIEQN